MRKRLSKKYKPTRVHKRWQKLNSPGRNLTRLGRAGERKGGFILSTPSSALTRFHTPLKCVEKRFAAYLFILFTQASALRQRARESVARRKMLQSSTVLNFHALRQRTQAIQPIIYRCHELSLQRIDLAITSESSHWTISSWRRSRKAHVIAGKVQSWPCGSNWGFRSYLAYPDIQFTLFL